MAVKIRLQRHGAKHAPVYRLVAADARKPRDGRFIEVLGTYHPKARGQTQALTLKLDRVDYWLSVGAQCSDTAHSLVKQARRDNSASLTEVNTAPPTKKTEKPSNKTNKSDQQATKIAIETQPATLSSSVAQGTITDQVQEKSTVIDAPTV